MKLSVFGRLSRTAGLWLAAAVLLLVMAAPALSTIFAAPGSVNTKAIVKGAVTSAKIKDKTIKNADIAAGAAIASSKISWPVQTRHLSIPASAFTPAASGATYAFDSTGGLTTTGGTGVFRASVNLPDGATITNFQFTAQDIDPAVGNLISGSLKRWSVGAGNEGMAATTTSGLGAPGWIDLNDAVIINPVVDNVGHTYYALVTFDSLLGGLQLGKVVITYTVAAP